MASMISAFIRCNSRLISARISCFKLSRSPPPFTGPIASWPVSEGLRFLTGFGDCDCEPFTCDDPPDPVAGFSHGRGAVDDAGKGGGGAAKSPSCPAFSALARRAASFLCISLIMSPMPPAPATAPPPPAVLPRLPLLLLRPMVPEPPEPGSTAGLGSSGRSTRLSLAPCKAAARPP